MTTSSSRLVKTSFTDDTGRMWMVLVPEGSEKDGHQGIPVGPPDTSGLGLPEEIDVRLNNQLFHRGLFTWRDVKRDQVQVTAALQAALKISATSILNLFKEA